MARFDVKLLLAIGAVWFIWGSTFAGMRVAVTTIPPFVMAASRFVIAGAALYVICVLRGRGRTTALELRHAAVSGAALLLLGNGVTAWTVQFLPTGINALLLSSSVIWMALIAFLWGGERPCAPAVAGMAVGLIGLAVLMLPHAGGAVPLVPALVAVAASVSWAFGSIYQRRVGQPADALRATALQMLAGGGMIAVEAALTGEWQRLDLHAPSGVSLAGLAYLVVFGSMIAYSAYQYTLHAAPTALATTYAYINPIVSVMLGFALFGERLTPLQGLGSAVIVAGVALMMWPARTVLRAAAAS